MSQKNIFLDDSIPSGVEVSDLIVHGLDGFHHDLRISICLKESLRIPLSRS
jgi:hypothetical protein